MPGKTLTKIVKEELDIEELEGDKQVNVYELLNQFSDAAMRAFGEGDKEAMKFFIRAHHIIREWAMQDEEEKDDDDKE